MIVLGIESSCDETGLALFDSEKGMIGHIVNSQHDIHSKYGGVVPELASRDHVLKLVPLLDQLLNQKKISLSDIGLIAFTNGPGLLGPLLTGASFAKTLAWSLKIKSIEIDHLEAHIFSPMITEKELKLPFISLLVSGGHTVLTLVQDNSTYEVLGKTLDDSAGEVFDKVARHLGLPYPGGPEISKASSKTNRSSYKFPRPMIKTDCYNFSFSGLKTHVTQLINKTQLNDSLISDIAYDFENAIIDVLITKTLRAAREHNIESIVIAGGVSANEKLRARCNTEKGEKKIFFPDMAYSTDNGAMIAYMGWLKLSKISVSSSLEINPNPSSRFV
jgi:N6-L-threonylcarbamoyladenine synthase